MKKILAAILIVCVFGSYAFAANTKITGFAEDISPTNDDVVVTVDITSGANKKATLGNLSKGVFSMTRVARALVPPTVAVNVAAGNLNGSYRYGVTFVNADGETELSTVSDLVSPVNQQVDLSAIPVSPNASVTARKIYRAYGSWATVAPNLTNYVATISDNTTTTYTDNIADGSLGAYAPQSNSTGGITKINTVPVVDLSDQNIFIGTNAGNLKLGPNNVVIGPSGAGDALTTGYWNVLIGPFAGTELTTGDSNVAIGLKSGLAMTTARYNTSVGHDSLNSATTALGNTSIGYHAMYYGNGNYNTSIGYRAGHGITGNDPIQNVMIGFNAGVENIGGQNSFVGYETGIANTGAGNVLFGFRSGYDNTTGNQNTFLGKSSGENNLTGLANVIVGYNAGFTQTAGNYNTFLGHYSGFGGSGSANIFIGTNAGRFETGSNTIIIDSIYRTNEANSRTFAPIYGVMAAALIDQYLVFNGGTRSNGIVADVNQNMAVTTEVDIALTHSLLLLTGDNDSDNDIIDLQNGTTAGQTLTIVGVALIDADDTITVAMTDTTCTGCTTILFDEIGDTWSLVWTGATWAVTGNHEVP